MTYTTPAKYTVTSRRIVPTGKGNLHEGQHAVCVSLTDGGFIAWGFGDTPEAAETDAVATATALTAPEAL